MMCYLDRTFCDQGAACKCGPYRKLTDEHKERAKALGIPVAMANFCGEENAAAIRARAEQHATGGKADA